MRVKRSILIAKQIVLIISTNLVCNAVATNSNFSLEKSNHQAQQTTLTDDDFVGLFMHLEKEECKGPELMVCEIGDIDALPVEDYLLNIDECLELNKCLSHIQILTYYNKKYQKLDMLYVS